MRSLNKGKSPHMILRAPEELRAKVDARRKALGLSRSAFLREAAAVAVGDRCCMAELPTECPHVYCKACNAWTVMELPDTAFCGHGLKNLAYRSGGSK